jgi:hypothetical protein
VSVTAAAEAAAAAAAALWQHPHLSSGRVPQLSRQESTRKQKNGLRARGHADVPWHAGWTDRLRLAENNRSAHRRSKSRSATTMAGSCSQVAMTFPHGSTTVEWPQACRTDRPTDERTRETTRRGQQAGSFVIACLGEEEEKRHHCGEMEAKREETEREYTEM